jgi:hypothetical protein
MWLRSGCAMMQVPRTPLTLVLHGGRTMGGTADRPESAAASPSPLDDWYTLTLAFDPPSRSRMLSGWTLTASALTAPAGWRAAPPIAAFKHTLCLLPQTSDMDEQAELVGSASIAVLGGDNGQDGTYPVRAVRVDVSAGSVRVLPLKPSFPLETSLQRECHFVGAQKAIALGGQHCVVLVSIPCSSLARLTRPVQFWLAIVDTQDVVLDRFLSLEVHPQLHAASVHVAPLPATSAGGPARVAVLGHNAAVQGKAQLCLWHTAAVLPAQQRRALLRDAVPPKRRSTTAVVHSPAKRAQLLSLWPLSEVRAPVKTDDRPHGCVLPLLLHGRLP